MSRRAINTVTVRIKKLRLVVISWEFFPNFNQNAKFIHDWPDKQNYPYGRLKNICM